MKSCLVVCPNRLHLFVDQPRKWTEDELRRIAQKLVLHGRNPDNRRRIDGVLPMRNRAQVKHWKRSRVRIVSEMISERPLFSALIDWNDALKNKFRRSRNRD